MLHREVFLRPGYSPLESLSSEMKSLLQSHKGHKVTKAKHRQMSNPTVNILQDEVNRPSLWYRAMWVNLESWRGRQRPRIGLERATRWLR